MALQGTLDTFSVPDVLRLLATTRQRGRLTLQGSRMTGRVWIERGQVADVRVDTRPDAGPVDALFEIVRSADGAFSFEAGAAPPSVGDADVEAEGRDVEELIAAVEERVAEWHEIVQVVPSTAAFVALAPELEGGSVTLDADTWRVVAVVAAGATVEELAETLGLDELAVCRLVRDLVATGVAICGELPPEDAWADDADRPPAEAGVGPASDRRWTAWDDAPLPPGADDAWADAVPVGRDVAHDHAREESDDVDLQVVPGPPGHGDESEPTTLAPRPVVEVGDLLGALGADDDRPLGPSSYAPAAPGPVPPPLPPLPTVPGLSARAAEALAAVGGDDRSLGGLVPSDAPPAANAEDEAQRGLLVKFLSSVRP